MSSHQTPFKNDATSDLSPTPQPDHTSSSTFIRPATRFLPSASPPRPAPVSSSTTLVQSVFVEGLLALSQKLFSSPETTMAPTSMKTRLTPTQKPGIEINRQEAIQRRNELLKRHGSEFHPMKSRVNRFSIVRQTVRCATFTWTESITAPALRAINFFS